MDATTATPTCPGCHFGCALDDYQCARGARFFGQWEKGEPIPERRQPGMHPRGKEGAPMHERAGRPANRPPFHSAMPTSSRCMMLLSITERILRERADAARTSRVAECIMRHDGSATNSIIAERTNLTDGQISEQIALLEKQGMVASRADERGRVFHELTEYGLEQAQVWSDERKAADAAFFAPLSDDEMEQFDALLGKVIHPLMQRKG